MSSGLNTLKVFPVTGGALHVVQSWASGEGLGRIWALGTGFSELVREDEIAEISRSIERLGIPPVTRRHWSSWRATVALHISDFFADVKFGKLCPADSQRGRETRATLTALSRDPFTEAGRLWMTIRRFKEGGSALDPIAVKYLLSSEEFREMWREAVKTAIS